MSGNLSVAPIKLSDQRDGRDQFNAYSWIAVTDKGSLSGEILSYILR